MFKYRCADITRSLERNLTYTEQKCRI